MIKLNDLAIGYNGEAILEHIDQEFDDGLIYGILAKSGTGKTTLLKTISGLLHPVHGEVVIDEHLPDHHGDGLSSYSDCPYRSKHHPASPAV